MKKIYFIGVPTNTKGIKDFNFIAEHILGAEFYWFCFKIDQLEQKKYKKINFIAGLNDSNLKTTINKEMDLMICCSHFEGFCLPIAEAMLLKKPIISYRLPEIENTYHDNIEYVECFDLNRYVDKVKKFILNNDYNKDKKKARDYIIHNYSPEIVARRILQIIM